MKVESTSVNKTVHATRIPGDEALYILAEHVATSVGVNLDADHVSYRAYFSSRSTSTGIEYDTVIEITENRDGAPRAATEK